MPSLPGASERASGPRLLDLPGALLWKRWPDPPLLASLETLLDRFRRLCRQSLDRGSDPDDARTAAFDSLCEQLIAAAESAASNGDPVAHDLLGSLGRDQAGVGWLQSATSLLGMLMHFSVDRAHPDVVVNHRRPGHPGSTYPNSPPVARLLASYALRRLFPVAIPRRCRTAAQAERFARRALRFRILDPSVESGQLLLEPALGVVDRVHRVHAPGSRGARRLNRALLGRLCRHSLWGMDRNPLSAIAVRTVFRLLGVELGIGELGFSNVLIRESLSTFREGRLTGFDCILNNPPWGEIRDSRDEDRIRSYASVRFRLESYVAFVEGSLGCLRPEGAYGLVLPAQALSTRYAGPLRQLLATESWLDYVVLLPRPAFALATVRGTLLMGRKRAGGRAPRSISVTLYPNLKPLTARGPVQQLRLRHEALGQGPWTPLWSSFPTAGKADTIELRQVARVLGGAALYRRGRGRPPQSARTVKEKPYHFSERRDGTVPALRGRQIDEFRVRRPRDFVLVGPWLAELGPHLAHLGSERVFVREICRRDGKLNAALGTPGTLPLRGVITVLPDGVDGDVLVAILNSKIAALWVSNHTASFCKVDFQCIKLVELRRFPIPVHALSSRLCRQLGYAAPSRREVAVRVQVAKVSRELNGGHPSPDRRREIRARLEDLVARLYARSEGPARA